MRLKLFVLFISIGSFIYGQEIFPGNDTSIILGKELKVKPLDKLYQTYGYEGFYKDEKLKKEYYGGKSNYDMLVDKVFKVASIARYKDDIDREKFKLKLRNSETGDIYFDYDPKHETKWHFQILGEINLSKDFFCRDVQIKSDKFTGDTTYTTKPNDGITFIKVKKLSSTSIYLSINQIGSTLNVGQKGLILLLENNKRIEKPEVELSTKSTAYGSGWVYNAFVELTQGDIKLLTENAITDDRLYIYDGQVKSGKMLMEYLKCLTQ